MSRFFNTTGPCRTAEHYMLPAEARIPDLLPFVERRQYFVVHAAFPVVVLTGARQTGKSTAMIALSERLRQAGYAAVYVTLEQSQGFTEVSDAEPLWLTLIARQARLQTDAPGPPIDALEGWPPGDRLREWLSRWSEASATPTVLLLDEADVVRGPALVNLLRQLRAGFLERPERFPASIALIGMRDLRDYLATAKDGVPVHPGSPFNIKGASLTLRYFTEEEVAALYAQHTADTGQSFDPAAAGRAYWWTRGQPYLVNALAQICVAELTDGAEPVTVAHVDEAKERLVQARSTHLDSLSERLKEPRVARVIQPILLGDTPFSVPYDHDDFEYCVDLGLVVRGDSGAEPACPLYREVLARQLSYHLQSAINRPWWRWQTAEGGLDFPALLDAFLGWWRENEAAIHAHGNRNYPEALPHLALMAFLQRVVNGGGEVMREYASGRGAVDLVVRYGGERFVVEVKRVFPGGMAAKRVTERGVKQLAGYLETLGEAEGWLIVFDQRPGRRWSDRLWRETRVVDERTLHLLGA